MTKIFNNKQRKTGVQHSATGTGSFAIDLPFLPDYLKAKFATKAVVGTEEGIASATDYIYWTLAAVTPTTFTFTVHYKCAHSRDIQWVAAKLPKNAEIIAH